MNKRMRELLAKIEARTEVAKSYMNGENKDIAKAEEILKEVDGLKKEYEVEEKIFESEKETEKLSNKEVTEAYKKIEKNKEEEKNSTEETKNFAKQVKEMVNKVLNEGAGESGGYTVPEDIVTKVERLRETKESLRDLITIKKVTTNSGKETYKTRGQATGFGAIDEQGKIPRAGSPSFNRLAWTIAKYGGYIPVTNELLEDSDENIESFITEWLADESRETWNQLILAVINENEAQEITDGLDGIKRILNVVLGARFKSTSAIITNDDGLQYLDTLKDENGRYLLQPDPTAPANIRLRAGATTVPVKVFSNDTLSTEVENAIPFIIGDLKEGIKGFDRKNLTLMTSQTAVVGSGNDTLNAFEQDLTLIRGIEREDVEMRDSEAFVNGYIVVSTSSAEDDNDEDDNQTDNGTI